MICIIPNILFFLLFQTKLILVKFSIYSIKLGLGLYALLGLSITSLYTIGHHYLVNIIILIESIFGLVIFNKVDIYI